MAKATATVQGLSIAVPQTTPEQAVDIAHALYGLDATASPLPGERDRNFRLVAGPDHYLLKISPAETDLPVLEMEAAALEHLALTAPDLPIQRIVRCEGQAIVTLDSGLHVRLTQWLHGDPILTAERTPALRRDVAALAARIGRGLRGFFHPSGNRELIWNLGRAGALRALLKHTGNRDQARLAGIALDRFDSRAPHLRTLRAQIIHNDLNHYNLLVAHDDPTAISGILDFGDMVFGPLVNELAIAIAHQLYDVVDVAQATADMAGAFHQVAPLEEMEIELLFDLVAARLASREIIVNWRIATQGNAGSYDRNVSAMAWEALARVVDLKPAFALPQIYEACGRTPMSRQHTTRANDLLARRDRFLGPTAKQFYQSRFRPVRGQGVWIYDENGNRYLDAYNNVPHVGHCHPHVTAAITRQSNTLNTHTRYLDETVLTYAERLTATLSHGLDTVVFVCTGTEANDLAWQIARAWSGGSGAIATDFAFHGNSTFVSRLDTYTLPEERHEPWLATVRAPRIPGSIASDQGHPTPEDHATQYTKAIAALKARGHDLAAIYLCPLFASDGLYAPPEGYMDEAVARIRTTNGLIVADEVQSGFGRVGDHMWGYQALGIAPDIVTLGKPIGNGFPLGALITRREILDRFAQTGRYFNTFGGNPVACAAGLAVLDVLEREDLQRNAREVGAHLKKGLEGLADISPLVRDVRGRGLFLGVELAREGQPAPDVARQAIEEMRRRGVLIGITGWGRNLLKVRPPMCVTRANADQIVKTLADTLGSRAVQQAL